MTAGPVGQDKLPGVGVSGGDRQGHPRQRRTLRAVTNRILCFVESATQNPRFSRIRVPITQHEA
jgi:hypothetical protein